MARITSLPSPEIIKGFKGLIDFVEWRGIFYVRKWPVTPRSSLSEAHFERAHLFGEVVKAYSLLAGNVIDYYTEEAQDQPRTARDLHVAAVLGHLHEASMSDFLDLLQRAVDALEAIEPSVSTEATLEALRALVQSLEAKDFSTQNTLAALLSELQLKADLTETQPVSAASLPLPAGAATQATLALALTALQIIDDFADPQNLLFGYKDRYLQEVQADSTDGTTIATGSTVPAGELWIISAISARHNDPTARRIRLEIFDGTAAFVLAAVPAVAQFDAVDRQTTWVLKQDDRLRAVAEGLGAGKSVFLYADGYKMKV